MKLYIYILVIFLSAINKTSFSQRNLLWVKQVGTKNNERLNAISKYIETDIVAAGSSLNKSDKYMYPFITRVSPGGTVLWEKEFETERPAKLNAICVDSKLNIYGAGSITDNRFDSYTDFFLMKTNGKGKLLWKKPIQGPGYDDVLSMIYSKKHNTITLAGFQDTRYYNEPHGVIMQVDTTGNKLWRYVYPGSYKEQFQHIIETKDGGIAFVGYEEYNSSGNRMLVVGKLDHLGNEQWMQTFDVGTMGIANSIAEIPEGGFIVGGLVREDTAPVHDIVILRLDSNGNKMWSKIVQEKDDEEVTDIIVTKENTILLLAYSKSRSKGKSDIWLLEFNFDGEQIWDKLLTSRSTDFGQRMLQNKYGGVVITGSTFDNMRGNWDGAMFYYQKSEAPVLHWKSPNHQNMIVDSEHFWVDARLTSKDSLNIVEVLHNGTPITEEYKVYYKSGKKSLYKATIKAEATLRQGRNYFMIKALNSYGETVSRVYSIHYAPRPKKSRRER